MVKKEENKKKIKKIKVLFTSIFILIILIFAVYTIIKLTKNTSSTFIIKKGKISQEETQTGYIIRNETVVKGDNYKNGMIPIIDEGKKVAKNENIFRYYSNSENGIKDEINKLNEKINDSIKNDKEITYSSETKSIDEQIEREIKKLNKVTDIQKIQEIKKSINSDINKKAEIISNTSSNESELKKLLNQKKDYENRLSNGSEYIKAPNSGILSYKIDGLESVLVSTDFSKYNKEFLDNLNLTTGQIISKSEEEGKIVDNYQCYLVFTSDSNEAKNAKIGDYIKIILPSTREIRAKVEYITKEQNDDVTITISFSDGIEELLNYRKISFDIIWWSEEGYKVPTSSIISKDNLNYVIRNRAGYFQKVLVKIVKQTDDFTIITNYSIKELNEINVEDGYKKSISLFDEILEKPTDEQIKEVEKEN